MHVINHFDQLKKLQSFLEIFSQTSHIFISNFVNPDKPEFESILALTESLYSEFQSAISVYYKHIENSIPLKFTDNQLNSIIKIHSLHKSQLLMEKENLTLLGASKETLDNVDSEIKSNKRWLGSFLQLVSK